MAKEKETEAAPAVPDKKKVWQVEWEVYETKGKEPSVRRKYFVNEDKAKAFAGKLRDAIELVGCSGSAPSYSPVEIEE